MNFQEIIYKGLPIFDRGMNYGKPWHVEEKPNDFHGVINWFIERDFDGRRGKSRGESPAAGTEYDYATNSSHSDAD